MVTIGRLFSLRNKTRTVTVLSVGYPLFPVAPDMGGGAEQILYLLDREIVRGGRRSLVVAASGSPVHGALLATPDNRGEITGKQREEAQRVHRSIIDRALRLNAVDLIHFHGLDFHAYIPETSVPILATLHLPLECIRSGSSIESLQSELRVTDPSDPYWLPCDRQWHRYATYASAIGRTGTIRCRDEPRSKQRRTRKNELRDPARARLGAARAAA